MRRLLLTSALILSACVVRVREPVVHEAVAAEVEVGEQPPPPQTELVTVAPSVNHFWVPGYWSWAGRWVWIGGRWDLRRHGHEWVQGHWEPRHHRWVWVPGHWRRL